MAIKRFDEQNQFLNNFYAIPISIDGRAHLSVGHAYAACKATTAEQKVRIANMGSAREVLAFQKTLRGPEDWYRNRVEVMRELLAQKFNIPAMRDKLLATGDQELIYGNSPDEFWGINERTGKGENVLGKLLMETRDALRTP